MIITDKELRLDKNMVAIADLIAERIYKPQPKLDYAMLISGDEGYGKSNIAVTMAYYIAQKTGRKFGLDNVFFDTESLLKFATTTEKQIIMWDEMALNALSMSVGDKWQLPIIQTLMMARKKRHLYLFCIPRFYRLKQHIIERCTGLIQVYARNQTQLGRFAYYCKEDLEDLYHDWKKKGRKPNYWAFRTINGTFGESISKVLDEDAYEKKKDEAIKQIMEQAKNKPSVRDTQTAHNYYKFLKVAKDKGLIPQIAEDTGRTPAMYYHFIRRFEERNANKQTVSPDSDKETGINNYGT